MSISRLSLLSGGLGNLALRRTYPTAETAFVIINQQSKTSIAWSVNEEEVPDERGKLIDVIEGEQKCAIDSTLMQSRKADMDLIMGHDGTRRFATRYYGVTRQGVFQYYLIPVTHVSRNNGLSYDPKLRTLRFMGRAIDDGGVLVVPGWDWPYLMEECNAEILIDGLQLWVAPHLKANQDTTKLYDLSGLERHGTVGPSGDVATIWHSDDLSLLFDGTDDQVAFGDICNIKDEDFAIEFWVKVPAANASTQEILSKYSGSLGYAIVRDSSNKISFSYVDSGDGSSFASTSTLLQNVWRHVMIAGDRSGSITIYSNGAADGAASMAAVGDLTNTTALYLGRSQTNYGNVQLGAVRIYNFGVDGLPSNMATIAARHYAAEKSRYGL
jgi:hypothetical protein